MSEQTPNSSEDLNGAEPSMEDILASIRKIISEDEPVAMESPEDGFVQPIAAADLTSDAVLDVAYTAPEEPALASAEGNSVDIDIDDVLASLDDNVLQDEPSVSFKGEAASSDMLETTSSHDVSDEDILSMLDMDIPMEDSEEQAEAALDEAPAAEAFDSIPLESIDLDVSNDPVADIAEEPVETDSVFAEPSEDLDLEMDALLDDILMVPDAPVDPKFDDAPVAESAEPQASVEASSDLDLVKSLMADLADDPDANASEEDLDALLAIPEVEEPAAEIVAETADEISTESADLDLMIDTMVEEVKAEQGLTDDVSLEEIDVSSIEIEAKDIDAVEMTEDADILGDILDMTLEDELQAQPDEVPFDEMISLDEIAEAEAENVLENEQPLIDEDLPSLVDIAAAAEADAVAAEESAAFVPAAALASAAAAGVGLTALVAASEAEPEILTEPTPDPIPTEEPSMPVKAVMTDAILDDVTETAAAGAFAELNQVVEDKAVFNERGPRIGDLVQEALRPMLKEWLDANLKGIVERAVTKEVKRISQGK